MKIEEISIENKEYPQKLRNIYDPPKKIYVLGNKRILNNTGIAIVGCRNATEYGKKVALKISKEIANQGINVISGLALGIDTYAHIGCIQAIDYNNEIGKTIAILGSGIDEIYPKENKELAKQIIKTGGCIISEYSTGIKPNRLNFPKRNRIISGISNGILVIEAKKKSGALITVNFGLEQGKEIFAIPGDITRKESEGCNMLIKDGAKIVLSANDILDEISVLTQNSYEYN